MNFDNICLYHVLTLCALLSLKKAEVQDQYPLSLNPVQKANNPIKDCIRYIEPKCRNESNYEGKLEYQHLADHISQKYIARARKQIPSLCPTLNIFGLVYIQPGSFSSFFAKMRLLLEVWVRLLSKLGVASRLHFNWEQQHIIKV